jgi:hypothetical protein
LKSDPHDDDTVPIPHVMDIPKKIKIINGITYPFDCKDHHHPIEMNGSLELKEIGNIVIIIAPLPHLNLSIIAITGYTNVRPQYYSDCDSLHMYVAKWYEASLVTLMAVM